MGPPTKGNWRLHLSTSFGQYIEPSAYIRTRPDGFLTSMMAVAPSGRLRHRVSIFNPASNSNQRSWLRLVNMAYDDAEIAISGVDDAGVSAPGGDVRLTLLQDQALALTAEALESGISDHIDLRGRLGDKLASGKWQLEVVSDQPIVVMSLLDTPTGHLSNLSAPSADYGSPVGLWELGFDDGLTGGYLIMAPDGRNHGWLPEVDALRVLDGGWETWGFQGFQAGGPSYESGRVEVDDLGSGDADKYLAMNFEYRQDDWMRGSIAVDQGRDVDHREFFGSAFNGFDRGADLPSLAGEWTADDGGFWFSVNPEGQFSGSLQVGDFDCELSGVLKAVHAAYALYRSAVEADCSPGGENLEMTFAVFDRPDAPGHGGRALALVVAPDSQGAVGTKLTWQQTLATVPQ